MFCVFSLVAGAENRSRLIVEVQRSFLTVQLTDCCPFSPSPFPVILMEGVWSRIEYPSIPRPSRKRAGHFPEIRNCGKLRRHRGLKGMPAGMAPRHKADSLPLSRSKKEAKSLCQLALCPMIERIWRPLTNMAQMHQIASLNVFDA